MLESKMVDGAVENNDGLDRRLLKMLHRNKLRAIFVAGLAVGCADTDAAGIDASPCDGAVTTTDAVTDTGAADVGFIEHCELRDSRVWSPVSGLMRKNWVNAAQVGAVGFAMYPMSHRYGPDGDLPISNVCRRDLNVEDRSVSSLWADITLRPLGREPIHVLQLVREYRGGIEEDVYLESADWTSLFPPNFEASDIPTYISLRGLSGPSTRLEVSVDLRSPVVAITGVTVHAGLRNVEVAFTTTEDGIAGGDVVDSETMRSIYPRLGDRDHTGCTIFNDEGKQSNCLGTNVCILQDQRSQCGDRRLGTGMHTGSNTLVLPLSSRGSTPHRYTVTITGADQGGNIGENSREFTY